MQLDTITMPRVEARKAYIEYRDAIRAQQTEELDEVRRRQLEQDRAIAQAYKALSVGRQLIRLESTVLAAGFDSEHRPHLAVCRADADECWMRRTQGGELTFMASEDAHRSWDRRVKAGKRLRLTAPSYEGKDWAITAIATAPNIPPEFRPVHHLRNYHLLWEAAWRHVRSSRHHAPRDPALLKHLGGDLWAVLAIWDLTEVERAALEAGSV